MVAKKKVYVDLPVEVVDLDKFLGKPRNRIERIGVELEGGWEKLPPNSNIERDSSVYKWAGDDGGYGRSEFPGVKFGEIPLGPYQPINLLRAMKKYWPSHVDKTCGMHVHMSFEKPLQYVLLADSPAYQDTVVEYVRRWSKEKELPEDHPVWSRLKGESEYCQRKFWPDQQMNKAFKGHNHNEHGHRYTMIHYCWERYRTVECRLLPMFDSVVLAHEAIRHVMNITNAYLLATDKSKVKEKGDVKLNAYGSKISLELRRGEVYEEFYED